VELFYAAEKSAHKPLPAAIATEGPGRRRAETATILVVEDEPDLRDVVADLLEDLGYRTLVAASGAAALRLLYNDRGIDMVFTDLVMPGPVDGLTLAEEARRLYPGIRIVFTSGYAEHPALRNRLPKRSEILLRKPYHRAELAATIAQAFD
jgi:CheY-like chemotaxis protein